MEVLRVSSHKVVDTLAHSQSTTNMSKSISGASLSSSQATQRTKCGSEFSSAGGPARFANLSSSSQAADALGSSCSMADSSIPRVAASRPAAAPGGGKTVVGGVAPTMEGMLRRRARFSGWKAEAGYFELRSTVLLSFSTSGSSFSSSSSSFSNGGGVGKHRTGGAGGGVHHSSGLATLAAKIMHTQTRRAGAWSWSLDLAGAERVRELPALTKKETFAFAVEFPASSKKKTFIAATGSADARERWMVAIDRARQSVRPQVIQTFRFFFSFLSRILLLLTALYSLLKYLLRWTGTWATFIIRRIRDILINGQTVLTIPSRVYFTPKTCLHFRTECYTLTWWGRLRCDLLSVRFRTSIIINNNNARRDNISGVLPVRLCSSLILVLLLLIIIMLM